MFKSKCSLCGIEIDGMRMFCHEHYLQKEANYAINDIDPNKKWDNPEDASGFRKRAIERLVNLAEYYIERDWK